jgi:hypothetical protein
VNCTTIGTGVSGGASAQTECVTIAGNLECTTNGVTQQSTAPPPATPYASSPLALRIAAVGLILKQLQQIRLSRHNAPQLTQPVITDQFQYCAAAANLGGTYTLADGSTIESPGLDRDPGHPMLATTIRPPPLSVYQGQAYGTTNSVRSDVSLRICDLDDPTSGFFMTIPPSFGGGTFHLQVKGDSIRIASSSRNGSKILWSGVRQGENLDENYVVISGQSAGQRGWWHMSRTSGAAMRDSLHAWH